MIKDFKNPWRIFLNAMNPRCYEYNSEPYSEPCQASKMELFAKLVNGWKLFTVLTESSIIDAWRGSQHSTVIPETLEPLPKFKVTFESSFIIIIIIITIIS